MVMHHSRPWMVESRYIFVFPNPDKIEKKEWKLWNKDRSCEKLLFIQKN